MKRPVQYSIAIAFIMVILAGCSAVAPQHRPLSSKTTQALLDESAKLEEQREMEEERRRQAYSSEEIKNMTSDDTLNSNWVNLNNRIDTINDEIRFRKQQERVLEFLDEGDRMRGGQI